MGRIVQLGLGALCLYVLYDIARSYEELMVQPLSSASLAPLILWLGYFYAHLGISFTLAALIATPGCEMRAIPAMLGRLTGRTSDEHQCPAAFITRIDAWEQRLRGQP